MTDVSQNGRSRLRFTLSWDIEHGYRVSEPQLLNQERLEVMPVAECERYKLAVGVILSRYETALKHVEMHGAGEAVRIAREALDA